MIGYAYISKDGNFIEGELPESLDKDKFCIMCAAVFGAGDTAQKELDDHADKVLIQSDKYNIIIKEIGVKTLLVVIGSEKDLESMMMKEGSAI